MVMRSVWDFRVGREYGQVCLEPAHDPDDASAPPPDDLAELSGEAFDPGIAAAVEAKVFVTPHRDSFDMQVRVWLGMHPLALDHPDCWPVHLAVPLVALSGKVGVR